MEKEKADKEDPEVNIVKTKMKKKENKKIDVTYQKKVMMSKKARKRKKTPKQVKPGSAPSHASQVSRNESPPILTAKSMAAAAALSAEPLLNFLIDRANHQASRESQ